MPNEDLERARWAFEEYHRTGEHQWDTIDPEVEIHDHDMPDAGTYRGHAGYLKWIRDWSEAWGEYSMEPERWIDAGDKLVLVVRLTATGRGSGIEVTRLDAIVWAVRDGKTVRIDYYNNEAEALAAAGLPAA